MSARRLLCLSTLIVLVVSCVSLAKTWVTVSAEVTAYTADTCGKTSKSPTYRVTASGKHVSRGTVAAPKEIPFNTRMYIPGYGHGVVQDRGGAIKYRPASRGGLRLDVYVRTRKEASKWGNRKIQVVIYPSNLTDNQVHAIINR